MGRRKQQAGRDMAPIVTSGLIVCLAVALALLGHIRLKAELDGLYTGIGRLDRELAETRRFNEKLLVDLATLTSPDGLGNRLRALRLALVMPGDDARVVLPEPAEEELIPAARGGRFSAGINRGSGRVH